MQQIVCEFCYEPGGGVAFKVWSLPICESCRLAAIDWIQCELSLDSHPITNELMRVESDPAIVLKLKERRQKKYLRFQKYLARKA